MMVHRPDKIPLFLLPAGVVILCVALRAEARTFSPSEQEGLTRLAQTCNAKVAAAKQLQKTTFGLAEELSRSEFQADSVVVVNQSDSVMDVAADSILASFVIPEGRTEERRETPAALDSLSVALTPADSVLLAQMDSAETAYRAQLREEVKKWKRDQVRTELKRKKDRELILKAALQDSAEFHTTYADYETAITELRDACGNSEQVFKDPRRVDLAVLEENVEDNPQLVSSFFSNLTTCHGKGFNAAKLAEFSPAYVHARLKACLDLADMFQFEEVDYWTKTGREVRYVPVSTE